MSNEPSIIDHQPSTELISDEIKFLITCCQSEPSSEDIKDIRSQIENYKVKSKNWESLMALASTHGVLPLFYKTLKIYNPSWQHHHVILNLFQDPMNRKAIPHALLVTRNTLPEHLLAELKAQYQTIAQRNMLMSAELIKILKLLKDNNIEALAFKGPALAQMAYGDITLRQYVDLDVLVKKEDIYKIDTLLKERGYQRVLEITPTQEDAYMEYAHDLGLYHPQSGVHFEMHWSLMNEDYPLQIDLDAIWKHPQTIEINRQEIETFPTEALLLYLCIHGSKHLWERIEWIKDIDLLIRTQEIDWEKISKEAKNTGFEKMVYLGLSLTSQLFHTSLPQSITQHIAQMKVLDELSNFVLQSWQTPQSTFRQTSAMLKLFPGMKEQLIYLHKNYYLSLYPKKSINLSSTSLSSSSVNLVSSFSL